MVGAWLYSMRARVAKKSHNRNEDCMHEENVVHPGMSARSMCSAALCKCYLNQCVHQRVMAKVCVVAAVRQCAFKGTRCVLKGMESTRRTIWQNQPATSDKCRVRWNPVSVGKAL